MRILYVAWQDPGDRAWHPVGRLTADTEGYGFVYTRGAEEARNFVPFPRMDDLKVEYRSHELFPLFANRLLPKTRPDYNEFLEWLNVRGTEDDPIVLLGRTGGIRETDSLAVFPCPEPTRDGTYHVHFFSHGLGHLPAYAVERVSSFLPGTRLYLMPDPQNSYDAFAMALRTDDPKALVGYCPRFLARDFLHLLSASGPDNSKVRVEVEKVNRDAPIQLRVLCNLTAPWPEGFRPCSESSYDPLV